MENIENEKIEMKTMSACMNKLQADGFVSNFMIKVDKLCVVDTDKCYRPEAVKIVNFYRFEGETDPSDSSILYAMETVDGLKGIIADAYGVYADREISKFMKEVEEIMKSTIPSKVQA
ncbi:MAG: hypothetical protein H7296_12445 [Bacteroidia bacterium]|nr:hypothetical protein [Bacteroidia bacterium]